MQEDQQKYIAKLDEFLENFFLSKLTKNQEALRKDPEELESKSNSSEASIPSTFDKEAVLFEGDNSSKKSQKISEFDQYINYKAGAQNNKDLPAKKTLEHKFDFLLLNFIKSNDAQQLESLNTLVKENPELNGYFATCLVNSNISSDLVIETFADKYQLLNRFFTLKKALSFKEKIEPKVLKFQENVAEVHGNFANKIFVKISEELLEKLDVNYKTKLLAQLHDLHFTKSNSKGVSGIKSYTSSIKLKIAGVDENPYATERYLDQKGNILIIFDKLGDHSKTPYSGKPIATIDRDFTNLIYTSTPGLDVSTCLDHSVDCNEVLDVVALGNEEEFD